ncbi:MAG: hypothetical protein ACJ71T_12080 [Actinomycetales bacterium]
MHPDSIRLDGVRAAEALERIHALSTPDSDHRRWHGATSSAGAPLIRHGGRIIDARRLMLAAMNPGQVVRATGGRVVVACGDPACISPRCVRLPADTTEPVGSDALALLRHLRRYYSDRHLATEMDAVWDSTSDPRAESVVREYVAARKAAPGFDARSWSANSHNRIPAETWQRIKATATAPADTTATCERCGAQFTARRSTARFCGSTCRSAAARAARALPRAS